MGGPSGGSTGGASLQSSSSATATSGDADGLSGSGNKIFNFGSNSTANQASATLQGIATNPFVIVGAIAIAWLLLRKK